MATISVSSTRSGVSGRSQRRQYRLLYYANEHGVAKRAEFPADSMAAAVEFALSDPLRRTVDIWEDGEFACRLSPDARPN